MRKGIRSIIPHDPRTGTARLRGLPVLALAACLLTACPSTVDDVTAAISPSPAPATTMAVILAPRQDPAIAIETPVDDGEVASPVSVTGTADVAGRELTIRVLDHGGAELAAIDLEVDCAHGCPGTFGTEVFFFIERREPGWIEVSGEANDGPAVSLVPVVLFPA